MTWRATVTATNSTSVISSQLSRSFAQFSLIRYYLCLSCQTETVVIDGSELQTSNIAAKMCPAAHESMPSMCTRCLLYAHVEVVLIFAFHFHLFFLYFFCLFCFVLLLFLQLCVRIEKNPGLGFSISGGISGQGNPFKPSDMVRPDPACQPVTASPAFPQSCHGNCCSLLQCFVSQSLCVSVCGAAVDLVNSESANLENQSLFDIYVFKGVKTMMRDHIYVHWSDTAGNLTRDWESVMLWFCYWYTCSKWLGVCWGGRSPRPAAYGAPS